MDTRRLWEVVCVTLAATAFLAGPQPAGAQYGPNPAVDYTKPNWVSSPVIRKFIDSLPGLGVANKNNLGQYIPVAVPDKTTYPGCDYYVLGVKDHTEKMNTDLSATKVRGYYQINAVDPNVAAPHYLGPMIIAQRNTPVRILFNNKLGTGAAGKLFLPVDTTIMGAGTGPNGGTEVYTQNRAELHLHGGFTPWISDGTPNQWITPAGETTSYPKGVSFQNVPDMVGTGKSIPSPAAGDGLATYYYPNQQSARLMFYHDHSYGMTRLNVYAGEAAPYLLQDPIEANLVTAGVIPTDQIPLIIQDKTFVPDANTLRAKDPLWDANAWGALGNLWFPHVYVPNQDPNAPDGTNPFGRWDYGPWFWPPMSISSLAGTVPAVSHVPEAFMDTPVINGTAYPYVQLAPKAYRLRILNVCNDRSLNLQLYYADPNDPNEVRMVPAVPHALTSTTAGTLLLADANSPIDPNTGLPINRWPQDWPTDGRDGGVPDPLTAGPAMIQIGTEGGLMPAPVVIPSTPVDYEYNRRNIVVLNVSSHGLLLGPAERADVIVDLSSVPAGSTLILYNDAPAPVPGFDPRLDYYTGDANQAAWGGAPPTTSGHGPNTRTLMQIRVTGTRVRNANLLANLKAQLPAAFAATQPPLPVPQQANGAAANTYSRIADTQLTFTPPGAKTPTTVPMQAKTIQELFDPYGRMNATLGVELPFTNFMTQTTIPYGYIDPPTETVHPGETQIWKITHNGVDTHFIHFHLFNVQVINRVGWDGMIKPPDLNEQGWKETVRMNPLEDCIVALQPATPTVPFAIPNSSRPLSPSSPLHSTMGFAGVDPQGNPVTVSNEVTNFGWEYVWHCHILGHEENDMMRAMILQVPTTAPAAPSGLTATTSTTGTGGPQVDLSWTVNSTNQEAFRIERATGTAGAFAAVGIGPSTATSFSDPNVLPNTHYRYRVFAYNVAGSSPASNIASVTTPNLAPAMPTGLTFVSATRTAITLSWTPNPANAQSIVIQRSTVGANGPFTVVATVPASTSTYTNPTTTPLKNNTTYWFRIQATNSTGASIFGPVVSGKTLP